MRHRKGVLGKEGESRTDEQRLASAQSTRRTEQKGRPTEAERILGVLKEDRLESFGTGVVNLNI